MNQYEKRVQTLERQRDERRKMPVVIVTQTKAGEHLYQGVPYSRKAIDTLMEKIRPDVVIIDNIPETIV